MPDDESERTANLSHRFHHWQWQRLFPRPSDVIYITCIQGLTALPRVNQITAQCGGVQPAHILISALAGIADALQIRSAIGIRTADQIANKGTLNFSYDLFFEAYGKLLPDQSAYMIRLPFVLKELSAVKAHHRNRTRHRREVRANVIRSVSSVFAQYVMPREHEAVTRDLVLSSKGEACKPSL